jgi:hypothetical protein
MSGLQLVWGLIHGIRKSSAAVHLNLIGSLITNLFCQCEAQDPIKEEKERERKRERTLIYKNVLLISFAFFMLFVAFDSMSKLQSSINTVRFFNLLSSSSGNLNNLYSDSF